MFMVSITGVLLKRLNLKEKYGFLILLPLFGVVFDFLENISSSIVMNQYPKEALFFANIAPFMTMFKWIILGSSFLSISERK